MKGKNQEVIQTYRRCRDSQADCHREEHHRNVVATANPWRERGKEREREREREREMEAPD